MSVPSHLLEVGKSTEKQCKTVLDFEGWRVAILRYYGDMDPKKFYRMGRHHKTNEVFVLDRGEADMVICENGDKPGEAHVIKMEQGVAYNVLQNVWHAVVMSRDAHIIIFEKSDTSAENTEYVELDEEVIDACKKQFASGKKKKAKKKKAKKSGRKGKAASSEDAANDPIQQLTLWPEFQ